MPDDVPMTPWSATSGAGRSPRPWSPAASPSARSRCWPIDAPVLADELTTRGWPLVLASGVLGATALALLWRDRPRGTRACAVGAVVAVLAGWGVAQYPYILPPSMTFADAAAPAGSLDALLVIFVVAALVIAPSLALLYSLDQRDRLKAHGVGTDIEGASVETTTPHLIPTIWWFSQSGHTTETL